MQWQISSSLHLLVFGNPSDNHIRHLTMCIYNHVQSFQLEELQDFYDGSGSRTPEVYSVSPD
jgi:hypothetical protein